MNEIFINHYSILGVGPDASLAEVKKAYRVMARRHHPDRPGGNDLKFHEIHTAYRILSDPSDRARFHEEWKAFDRRKTPAHSGLPEGILIPESRIRFPGSMERLARRGLLRKSLRSGDRKKYLRIDYDLELLLAEREIATPIYIRIPVPARRICPDCLGSDPDCHACNGRGYGKISVTLGLHLSGGLRFGQVLEVDLNGFKPEPLSHFKKRTVRLKISRLVEAS